jgi:anthranilate phosphoribosyltransferase
MRREDFLPVLETVRGGNALSETESAAAFDLIMSGGVAEADLATFLKAIAERQPTIGEIVGAARAMRRAMTSIETNPYAIDLCGTGGDGASTLNISTACAFVVAASGVPVAKHGNRNMSSKSGTADVLEALGVNIALSPAQASQCLRQVGLCFLYAQAYHPAMQHVANVRRQLGIRTIFNLLGPISNPARVRRQLVGVYDKSWTMPIAEVLGRLGAERAWVVNGDGLDEISVSGTSHVAVLEGGKVTAHEVTPEDAGVGRWPLEAVRGGDPQHNAAALRRLLDGERGAYRDSVLINSAGALVVTGKATDLRTGVKLATEAIDSGAAREKLESLVSASKVPA